MTVTTCPFNIFDVSEYINFGRGGDKCQCQAFVCFMHTLIPTLMSSVLAPHQTSSECQDTTPQRRNSLLHRTSKWSTKDLLATSPANATKLPYVWNTLVREDLEGSPGTLRQHLPTQTEPHLGLISPRRKN